jgi:hypothetical protein
MDLGPPPGKHNPPPQDGAGGEKGGIRGGGVLGQFRIRDVHVSNLLRSSPLPTTPDAAQQLWTGQTLWVQAELPMNAGMER